MVLELYVDPLSQPSRALMLFVRAAHISEAKEQRISVRKGENKTPEFEKLNPFQKVPVIIHNGFQLTESVAILRYLARAFPIADHWYPHDPRGQARVDEYLEWQHLELRGRLSRFMLANVAPWKLGYESKPGPLEMLSLRTAAEAALNDLETLWLRDKPFLAGQQISIADLLAVGEIEMTKLSGINARAGRPRLSAFLDLVRRTVGIHLYDEVHCDLEFAAAMIK